MSTRTNRVDAANTRARLAAMLALALAAALPISVQAQSYSRTETIAYHDDLVHWVLGQVTRVECVASTPAAGCAGPGTALSQTTYDATSALPIVTSAFGKLQRSATYNADGTLATVTDGNNRTTTFSNWKRGIPATVAYADGSSRSAVVDNNGWISSVTDEAGSTTGYAYDSMGRIVQITYPSNDNVPWLPTTINYVVASDELGIVGNHWRQTIGTGHAKKVTYFDALWRPILTWEYDDTNAAGTSRFVATAYDGAGRPVDVSYPLGAAPSLAVGATAATWSVLGGRPNGVQTAYDVLGRPTSVTQDAEAPWGTITTTMAYLTGFQTRVTNPRTFATTTGYQAWDSPTTDYPVAIAAPEGAYTDIARDAFGKPLSITRRNSTGSLSETRSLVYDGFQQLCKTVEPETGATAMSYDAAGNLVWSAAGLSLTSTTSCDAGNVPADDKVYRQYDARNRLTALSFPGGKGDQAWTYTLDGLPGTIETANDTPADIVTNTYSYNKRRLPVQETLAVPGQPALTMAYGYNTNGALGSHVYPDGTTVAYAPNALGQPTQAGSYATGVGYYPNGAMSGFTYGNGVVHSLQQNARGLPEHSVDSGGVLDDSYDYDKNGNVAAISDGLAGNRGDRTMTYDALDRLTDTTSPMYGTAGTHYSYDVLDNLTHVIAPGENGATTRDLYYCYDTSWRLTNLKTGSCSGSTVTGLGYDERGNLENKSGQHFVFDFGNRLRSATGLESYRYDGYGRRVSASSSAGSVYSFYGQDGALRYQRDERQSKTFAYVSLNGSLLARKSTAITLPASPAVPALTVPAISTTGNYSVSWTTSSGAAHYELSEQMGAGSWAVVQDDGTTSRSFSAKADGSYGYRVRACAGAGSGNCSGYSATGTIVVTTTTIATPAVPALTVPATSNTGGYTASWSAVANATHYELSEQVGGGAWAVIDDTSATSRNFSDKVDGSYGYRVRACNGDGTGHCSGYSPTGTVSVTIPLQVPAVPTLGVPGTSSTGVYAVSWSGSSIATHFELGEQVGGGAWTVIQDTSATNKAISGKTDGSYGYRVRACNGAGTTYCSAYSSVATVVVAIPPPPPAVPTLTLVSSVPVPETRPPLFDIELQWSTSAGATYYDLQQNTWIQYSGTDTDYTATVPGSADFHVRACNTGGCSAWSNAASSPPTPAVPTLTVPATSSTGSYTASWSSVSNATHYELSEQVGGGSWAVLQDTSALSKAISGKANGSYGYRLRACNGSGAGNCSDYTATSMVAVSVPVIPVVPTLTVPGTTSTGSYTASWNSVSNATHYELSEQVGGGSWTIVQDTGALSMAISGKANGSYGYRLRACNGSGTSYCSGYTATATTTVSIPVIPAVPTLTVPNASSTGSYTASWTSVSNATHYELSEQVGSGTWTMIQDTSALSRAITGKASGSYGYRLRACNGSGTSYCSGYTGTATIVVTIPPPPAAPTLTLVSSVPVPGTRPPLFDIELQWNAPAGATYYDLQRSTFIEYSGTDTDYTTTVPGSADFHVRACNAGGCSAWSNAASSPPTPAVPTLSVPATNSTGSYTASWGSVSNATHYELSEQVGGGSWAVLQDTSALSKAISGKANGNYGYRLRACNGSGTGNCSDYTATSTITVTLPNPVPAAPTLTLVSSVPVPDTRPPLFDIELQWSSPAYTTYFDLQQGTWIQYTGTDTDYTATVPGSATFHVRACNASGCSAWSAVQSTPPTPAVPALTVPGTSSTGSYSASWASVSNATHYELSEQVGGGSWAVLQDTSALSKAISGKGNGSYGYRLRACNGSGTGNCSDYTATSTITVSIPATPTVPPLTLPATSSTGSYTASWTSVSNATHYELSEQVNGGSWTVVQDTSALSKAISGKASGSYGYRLRACNGSGTSYCSGYTATSTITVAIPVVPAVPTLSVPATSNTGSYTVSWSSVSSATHYELSEQTGGGSWTVVQDTSALSRAISGKGSGSYGYRLRACNGSGASYCSAYTATSTITVSIPATPAVPTLTVPATSSTGSYTATWTTVSNATHYELSELVGSTWTVIQDTSATSKAISGKGNGSYGYRVRACNGSGAGNCSAYTATSTITVSIPVTIPGVPTMGGSKTLIDPDTKPVQYDVYLYWSAQAGATYYDLKKSTYIEYTGPDIEYTTIGVGSLNYQVRACNSAGCSAYSATFSP